MDRIRNTNEKFVKFGKTDLIDCKNFSLYTTSYTNLISKHSDIRSNIGIYIPNSDTYIKWIGSCYYLDRIVVPIFYGASIQEVINTINSCDIQILIYKSPLDIDLILNKCRAGITLINCDTLKIISNNQQRPKSKAPVRTDIMISTSGSLNSPKRVMLCRDNIVTNARDIIESLQYNDTDVFLVVLPMCFASAFTSQLTVAFLLGAKIVPYYGILHPVAIATYIKKYNVTSITLTPTLFKMIVDCRDFSCEKLPSIKTICFGGGPSDLETIEKAKIKFNKINLVQMYGQTEASARISHMRLQNDSWISESVGKPIGNIKVRIADKNGTGLPIGSEGRVQIKGDNVFLGYYGEHELTSETFVNGWLNTGDIGKIDNEGNIYIVGREKNIIIYNGFNIYPEEIENIISVYDGVDDTIVYGKSDSVYGEIIVAEVKIKNNFSITDNDILKHCVQYLPQYKIPQIIIFTDHINKTANGKKARKR